MFDSFRHPASRDTGASLRVGRSSPDASRDTGASLRVGPLARMGFVFAVLLACGTAIASGAKPPAITKSDGRGSLWVQPNPDLIERLGLRADGIDASAAGEWRIALQPLRALRIEIADTAPTRVIDGVLDASALRLTRTDGASTPPFAMRPDATQPLAWELVDADARIWFRINNGMRSPDGPSDGLRLVTADFRVGPALAAWSGLPDAEDRLLGNASLRLAVEMPASVLAEAKSCLVPNWPGTPGFVADVELVHMSNGFTSTPGSGGVDVRRCRVTQACPPAPASCSCDGPGGLSEEVVFVPSAYLRNRQSADAADIPWFSKFTSARPPYGNDQHPFLVWNLYRLDAEGRIEQIARSGLKHAFATMNSGCHADARCPVNGNILGRSCGDLYNAGSNDLAQFLSPRRELIPKRGIWGRCGSEHDDVDAYPDEAPVGCDGADDGPLSDDGYRHRMVVRDADIAAASNPGAIWLIDSWYIVRDDINIYNTMGYRSMQPTWTGNFWNAGALGSFSNGSVIDAWLARASSDEQVHRSTMSSAEGDIGVAARVKRLPDGRYRYDYALMNFDFSRAITDATTSEPNLRLLLNVGLSTLEVQLAHGAAAASNEYRDGDAAPGNDWSVGTVPDGLRFSAVGADTFEWGQLRFLRLVSESGPAPGELRMGVDEAGVEASYTTTTLVPDGHQLLRDGYE